MLTKSLGPGGAERLIVNSVLHGTQESFGYQVAYVLSSESHLAPELARHGIPVHDLGARNDYDLRWLPRLRTLLRRERFDLVHSHLPYSAALGRLVVRSLPRAGRPRLVYTEHCDWARTALPVRALNRLTIRDDSAIIAVSEAARAALPTAVRRRAAVVVHGIDPPAATTAAERAATKARLGAGDGQVLALTVANLRPQKGYEILLEAARSIIARGLPVTFVAAGSGPLEGELRAIHERTGLGEAFRLLGHRDDVAQLLGAADLFVLASHYEGLPLALMEAMAAAKPVVTTSVGGIPDVVVDGHNGLLVPPARPDLLADAITALAKDPARRLALGTAARETSARFDARAASSRVEACYRSILGS